MKYLEQYLKEKIKISILGELTTVGSTEGDNVGISLIIDGYEPGIEVWYADYANWLEEKIEILNTKLANEQNKNFTLKMKCDAEDSLNDFLTDSVNAGINLQNIILTPNKVNKHQIKSDKNNEMNFDTFKKEIYDALKYKPDFWRNGRFVFNYIEENYGGVGGYVELIEGVNCYYDDEKIDEFISLCYKNLGKDINDINVNGI